ncbi:hypothetical protein RRG08_051401 [Elysia crispata]|uniref:Uncharacterized protein n=1 Tax=Elysia crispata TaxID=231223 RepID=A0AAE1E9E6_9GAST|nr:hypothetical protein RRG08_051401 [Elysia crispata]
MGTAILNSVKKRHFLLGCVSVAFYILIDHSFKVLFSSYKSHRGKIGMSMDLNPVPKNNQNKDVHVNNTRKNSIPRPIVSQDLKQESYKNGTVSTELKQRNKEHHPPQPQIKKPVSRVQVGNRMRGGVKVIQNSGDFLGRLGTLVVMIVTMISTAVVTVSSFVEGVYWKFGLLAALLLFVHLPVTIAMIWMMCKARVKSIYKKVRPVKTADAEMIIVEAEEEEGKDTLDTVPISEMSGKNKNTKSNTTTNRGFTNKGLDEDGHA